MYEIYRNSIPTGYKNRNKEELKKDLDGLLIHPDNKEWIKAEFKIR